MQPTCSGSYSPEKALANLKVITLPSPPLLPYLLWFRLPGIVHKPATQLLGIPNRGKHSDANGKISQWGCRTVNFPPRFGDKQNPGWNCHLQAVAFSFPLMLASRGRGWEEAREWGSKAVLFGQSAGRFACCLQEVRVRPVLPSYPAHTHPAS